MSIAQGLFVQVEGMRILSRIRTSSRSECTDESRDSLNFRGSNPQLQKFLLGDLRRGPLILPAVMSVGIFLSCREAGAVIPGSEPNQIGFASLGKKCFKACQHVDQVGNAVVGAIGC